MNFWQSSYFLTDACFWLAVYDPRDQHHHRVCDLFDKIKNASYLLIPWPVNYEVLRTRLVKKTEVLHRFLSDLKSPRITVVDDSKYRQDALEEIDAWAKRRQRCHGLVDMVIRQMLLKSDERIDGFITFNERDFIDICQRRKIPVVSGTEC